MRRVLFNLHLYGALFVGLFVVIIGFTGSIIAFEEEIDRLLNPGLFRVQPQGPMLSPSGLLTAASNIVGQRVGYLRLPQSPDETVSFANRGTQAFLNPYTGALVGTRKGPTMLGNIHQIHLRLLMGSAGATIVTVVTGVLLFLVITEVYLWWQAKRVSVNWKANALRVHFDVHNMVGIYSAAFLLVLGITGIVIHYDGELENYLHARNGTVKIAKNIPSTPQSGATPVSADQAVEAALQALPGTKPLALALPANAKASCLVALRFPEDLTPGGRSWANVDQYSGKVVSSQSSRMVASGTRTIIWNRAIHTGDVFGNFSKVIVCVSSLMLVVQAITGYFLWWKKLRSRQRQ